MNSLSPDDWTVEMESFTRRGNLLHGWGILRGSGPTPRSAKLLVDAGRGIQAAIGATVRHPDNDRMKIDFVLYGALPENFDNRYLLVLEWADTRQVSIPLPRPVPTSSGTALAHLQAMPWRHYLARGWRLVRQCQFGPLFRKLANMTSTALTLGWHPVRLLQWAAAENRPLALVIDHDLGGGANVYRHALLARLVDDGYVPLLLTAQHGLLAYRLTATRRAVSRSAHVDDLHSLFGHFAGENIRRTVFNNIVSFPAPLLLVSELTRWIRQYPPEQFLFLVHDYYSTCPIWQLLNHTGQFCGIPDVSVCSSCLRANNALFLEFAAGASIVKWRTEWGSLLECASEIRCFSSSSRTLMLRAHPHLAPEKISVVPHALEHARLRPIALSDGGAPVIGVVGEISAHKGSEVIRALAEHIQLSESSARIVVVGTIDVPLPAGVATVTGPYRQEQLPDLLEKHGVNIGFFSSIWPETFSYVTEELMTMGLPLVAFDIGAPGERVARYARGSVLPIVDADVLLERIVAHYKQQVPPIVITEPSCD